MKILLAAHPDDECLIAAPEKFDKIVIVFGDRIDRMDFAERRKKAIAKHPLKDKIIHLNLEESNYWRDKNMYVEYSENYEDLRDWLKENIKDDDEITTHNFYGEYGHDDHKLCWSACMDTVNCKVNGQDPKIYRDIKQAYKEEGVWTWDI